MQVDKILKLSPLTFSICVLWIAGLTVGRIAMVTQKTPGTVRGVVGRAFATPRDDMDQEARQVLLDLFKTHRRDGGALPLTAFIAQPLKPAQVAEKKAEALPAPADTMAARKKRKILLSDQKRKKQKADHHHARQYELRSQGFALSRGMKASALEYLSNRQMLADNKDKIDESLGPKKPTSSGFRRYECGTRLRNYIDGTRIGGLNAVDYERTGGGGGGGGSGTPLPAYRLQCIHALGEIRSLMTKQEFAVIEGVVDRDEFVWEDLIEPKRKLIYELIRRALDIIGVYENLMDRYSYQVRWRTPLPTLARVKKKAIQSQSREASRVISEAKRPVR